MQLNDMRELKRSLKALSDETRLRILRLLITRECCVCEVMQVLDISQSRASRNLNVLHNAGFLEARREGLWSYYSVNQSKLDEVPSLLLKAVQSGLKKDKTAASDLVRLKQSERLGPCCGTT
jgi:ArsR family transcriptional regulator